VFSWFDKLTILSKVEGVPSVAMLFEKTKPIIEIEYRIQKTGDRMKNKANF
jgi:hypothetical protein